MPERPFRLRHPPERRYDCVAMIGATVSAPPTRGRAAMKRLAAALALCVTAPCLGEAPVDLRAEATRLQAKPDIELTGRFDFAAPPGLLDGLLAAPMVVADLWRAHGFTPRYRVRLEGRGLHVDDPTGIQGDVYLVERTPRRFVWVGFGSLSHALVPHFKGRMAMVVAVAPSGSGSAALVTVYVRADSRVLGAVASVFFPLVRSRVEHRMGANAADLGVLVAEVAADPGKAAARLGKDEAAALLRTVEASRPVR